MKVLSECSRDLQQVLIRVGDDRRETCQLVIVTVPVYMINTPSPSVIKGGLFFRESTRNLEDNCHVVNISRRTSPTSSTALHSYCRTRIAGKVEADIDKPGKFLGVASQSFWDFRLSRGTCSCRPTRERQVGTEG